MDARLLDYYNRELGYLREMGAEFAEQFPKVAGRLGMHGIEVADPYVERLLEGFSFLTARVQLKMDAQFPRFTEQLLTSIYPGYLAPTPSMAVVQLQPDLSVGSLASGFTLPAKTALRAGLTRGEQTACEFRTGHAVTLWPLTLEQVRFGPAPSDVPARLRSRAKAALRINLQFGGGQRCEASPLDKLTFHLAGPEQRALRLLELVAGHTVAVLCRQTDSGNGASRPWGEALDASAVRHEGFDREQALLPSDERHFQGYRILQEYFAYPARLLFFSIAGLQRALRGVTGTHFEITILLDHDDPTLERLVGTGDLAMHCTPVVNLFAKRADRVLVSPKVNEYHLVVDRSKALDFEVHSVTSMLGHGSGEERQFRPFHASFARDARDHGAYYCLRREARLLSQRARQHGARTSYSGSDVHISLVDQHEAPFADTLRQLSVDTLCTNRDLALLLSTGGDSDFTLNVSAPVGAITTVRAPSRPQAPLADGKLAWQLISHLGLNHQGLFEQDGEQGAAILRQLLGLYLDDSQAGLQRQVEGVRSVVHQPLFRRLPQPGPPVHGRGVKIGVTIDEQAFSGDSPYLFGAVLEQFFARYVSINLFAELELHSAQRGRVASWPARLGNRPLL
ncbi:type VI secretion system baseplate subunit TssF [Massilia sp. P8910]|uniref:type VI secretion system baseplate subunit TssF n=1 Tax=Massilia antarctica TaxID=2765360 RepID=UPI001E63628C|nr:type VI secretion system baseplate subunit TssF [Massilia antarctica]MCE3605340.1 type VI secretion system baseplate subunit TssF [Massilia antarctica]